MVNEAVACIIYHNIYIAIFSNLLNIAIGKADTANTKKDLDNVEQIGNIYLQKWLNDN